MLSVHFAALDLLFGVRMFGQLGGAQCGGDLSESERVPDENGSNGEEEEADAKSDAEDDVDSFRERLDESDRFLLMFGGGVVLVDPV